jgi:CHAD domain-containing protein
MPDEKNISGCPATCHRSGPYSQRIRRHQGPAAAAVKDQKSLRSLFHGLTSRLEVVRYQAARAVRNPDADAIHDARVASRRAAAVLGILAAGRIVKRSEARGIRKTLRKMRRHGGVVRDWDILLQSLSTTRRPGETGPLERWRHYILQRRSMAVRLFIKSAMSVCIEARLARLPTQLSRMDAEVARKALYSGIYWHLRAARKKAKKKLRRAMSEQSITATHQARISVKSLRYLYELGTEAKIISVRTLLARLRNFQTLAGNLNDYAMAMRRLDELRTAIVPSEPSGDAVVTRLMNIQRSRIARLTKQVRSAAQSVLESPGLKDDIDTLLEDWRPV